MDPAEGTAQRLRRWLEIPLSYQPAVAGEGDGVFFLSNGGGLPELYQVSLTGGSPRRILSSRERVGDVLPAPTDRRAVIAVDRGGNEHWQLGLVEPGAAAVRPLTEDPEVIHLPGRWTDGGERLLFSSNQRDRRFFDVHELTPGAETRPRLRYQGDAHHVVADAWRGQVLIARANTNLDQDLLSLDEDRVTPLTPHEGELTVHSAALLGDGVYAAANPGRELAALVRYRTGSGSHEFVQTYAGEVELIVPDPARRQLAVVVNRDGWSEVHLFDPATREDRPLTSGPRGVVSRISFAPDGEAFVYDLSSVEGMEVYRRTLATGKEKRLTGAPRTDPRPISPPKLGRITASDRIVIPYWEYPPAGPARGTILHVHGGPEAQARPGFSPFVSFLVESGFRVVAPNVRGSTGYGRSFTHLDDVRKRMDSVRDLAQLARDLVRTGRAQEGRIGLIGGSYGGFMVLSAAATYPSLWGAAVDLVGIANWVTFLERTGAWRRRLREAEYGSLESDRAFLEDISPIRHAGQITAPLLVIHGRNDPRVPVGEAEQIAATLTERNRPVELLIFEDEGHGIVRRENQQVAWGRAADFFERYLVAGSR